MTINLLNNCVDVHAAVGGDAVPEERVAAVAPRDLNLLDV